MRNIKDRMTGYLFDPWYHVGEKRLKLLKESWAGFFKEQCLPELPVEAMVSQFHKTMGRPSKEIYTAVGAIILQHVFDMSDDAAMHAIAFDVMWQYALDIPDPSDDSAYMCPRTLWRYRNLATKENLDDATFTKIAEKIIKYFKVDLDRQRIDSAHFTSNMRKMGRAGIFAKSIKAFLIDIGRRFPVLYEETISGDMRERYLSKKGMGCFSRVKPSEVEKTLKILSEDLLFLVNCFLYQEEVAQLKSFHLLQRVLQEQCTCSDEGEKITVKPSKEVPSDSLQNPSDPDATYDGHKGQGYQIQIMETYTAEDNKDGTKPDVITYVEVEPAHVSDAHALIPAIKSTQDRDCAPEALLADSLYGSDENIETAAKLGVEIIAPAMGSEQKDKKLCLTDFTVDKTNERIIACPAGQTPVRTEDMRNGLLKTCFNVGVCQACSHREKCPTRVGKRTAHVFFTPKQIRLAIRRNKEETEAWRDVYRMRSGIEGTMSRYKSQTGAARLRVRGLERVRFAAVMKAVGLNILRASRAWAAMIRKGVNEEASRRLNSAYCFFYALMLSFLAVFSMDARTLALAEPDSGK